MAKRDKKISFMLTEKEKEDLIKLQEIINESEFSELTTSDVVRMCIKFTYSEIQKKYSKK